MISGKRILTMLNWSKKSLGILGFSVMLCLASVVFVVNNNARMTSYERQLTAMQQYVEKASELLESRVKREIVDRVQSEMEHSLTKRANTKGISEPRVQLQPRYSGGVSYIRWGRKDCPQHEFTRMIYTGIAAGSYLTHTGGGANYICLPWNVTYLHGKYVDGNQGTSYIYGVEYRDAAWINSLFNLSETEASSLQFHSMPCVVCLTEGRASKIMIPGHETCPAGDWNVEYTGYLMSANHGDKHASEYICIDDRPHVIPGTIGDQKGASIHVVETQCNSLLCEPFVAGRELRCVVCSM